MSEQSADKDSPEAALAISSPMNSAVLGRKVRITGTCETNKELKISARRQLYPSYSSGVWAVDEDLSDFTAGVLTVFARQGSNEVSRTYYVQAYERVPEITHPSDGDVFLEGSNIEVSGTALTDAIVTIKDAVQGELGRGKAVEFGEWTIPIRPQPGNLVITATQATDAGTPNPSIACRFQVKARVPEAPAITAPGAGSTLDTTFTLSGDKGIAGGIVSVFIDRSDTKVGESGRLSGPNWSASVTLPVGSASLVALQTVDGIPSPRSGARLFRIRPPKLANIAIEYPTATSAKFSGAGHTGATVSISLVSNPGGATPPPSVVVAGGIWNSTSQNWPKGEYRLRATQSFPDSVGDPIVSEVLEWSVSSKLPQPTPVDYTQANFIPTFIGGGGVARATIHVNNKDGGAEIARSAELTGANWTAAATVAWAPGEKRVVVITQKLGTESSPPFEKEVTIDALSKPTDITWTVANFTPTFTGRGGINGATVHVNNKVDGAEIAKSDMLTSPNWTAAAILAWRPGEIRTVRVTQKLGDAQSGSEDIEVTIPGLPQPTDVSYTVVDFRPIFTGKGIVGATVSLTITTNGVEAAPPVTLQTPTWSSAAPQPWQPGTALQVSIVQTLNGVGSTPLVITVTVAPDAPTDVTYEVNGYTPVFKGKGLNRATVHVRDPSSGTSLANDVVVANQSWMTSALTSWGPTWARRVRVVQSINSVDSTPVDIDVTIPPQAPTIEAVVDGDEQSPTVCGTCWPDALLVLTFDDSNSEHKPGTINGIWSFQRPQPFVPNIKHTATVIQTVAQQQSPSASATFRVKELFPPTPQPNITYPAEGEEVHRDLIVRGNNGLKGATLQLYDRQFDRTLGAPKLLAADGEWFIELTTLEFRPYTIDAIQQIDGRESDPSDIVTFTVVVLPPQIDVPKEGGKLPRRSTISGTGMPFARVTVWLVGKPEPLLEDILVDDRGNWRSDLTLPVGSTAFRVIQAFNSEPSRELLRTFDVVPNPPLIETPVADDHIDRSVVVSGFGYPGDSVTVRLTAAGRRTFMAHGPVLEDRTWSVAVLFDQSPSRYELVAVASRDVFESEDSLACPVVLGTYRPTIDVPEAGRWVNDPAGFEGRGRRGVGRVVSWYNPERVLAANIAVTASGWRGESEHPMSSGGNWCRFKQTIDDGADASTVSEWVESERFEGPVRNRQ